MHNTKGDVAQMNISREKNISLIFLSSLILSMFLGVVHFFHHYHERTVGRGPRPMYAFSKFKNEDIISAKSYARKNDEKNEWPLSTSRVLGYLLASTLKCF